MRGMATPCSWSRHGRLGCTAGRHRGGQGLGNARGRRIIQPGTSLRRRGDEGYGAHGGSGENRSDSRHRGPRRGIRIRACDQHLDDVRTHGTLGQPCIQNADECGDVIGRGASGAPPGEASTALADMDGVGGHPAMREPGIVEEGEPARDRCEHGDRVVSGPDARTARGNLPGEREAIAGECRGAKSGKAGMDDTARAQGLAANAISLDEVGWQREQGRDGRHVVAHMGIVHRARPPMR